MEQSEKVRTLKTDQQREPRGSDPEKILAETRKDMGKVALFVSLLTVVLVVVLYFVVDQNISGLSGQVQEAAALEQEVNALDARVADMENLPAQTRNLILSNDLAEMSQKAEYLSGQLEGEEAAKLEQAGVLLREIQQGLGQ